MTLNEAIRQCEEIADYDCYSDGQRKRAGEYRQIAEWLKAYKEIIESGDCNTCRASRNCCFLPQIGRLVRYNCPFYYTIEEDK